MRQTDGVAFQCVRVVARTIEFYVRANGVAVNATGFTELSTRIILRFNIYLLMDLGHLVNF